MSYLKKHWETAAFVVIAALMIFFGWRMRSQSASLTDLAMFIFLGMAILLVPFLATVEQVLRKLGEAAVKAAASAGAKEDSWPRERTHRQDLELALVSYMGDLPRNHPEQAGRCVKEMLDTLLAQDGPPMPAPIDGIVALPVVDPGPDAIKHEIQAKDATGPCVTSTDVEREIVREHIFTAEQGAVHPDAFSAPWDFGDAWKSSNLGLVTICVLVLRNGAKAVGINYGAIDPANHNAEIGRQKARAEAVEKVWGLLNFRLRDELARPVLTEADSLADLNGTPRPSA